MSWFSRLANALNSRRLDNDLSEEMQDHLQRRAAAFSEKGLDPQEARRQARLRFGNTTRLREQSRGIRLWPALEGTLQDIRYGWRGMCKAPAFAVTVLLSLALAIGANTAVYSLLDAAILRPLPVSRPHEIFTLWWPGISDPGGPASDERDTFSYPEYLQFVSVTKPAARLAFFSWPLLVEAQGPNPDAPLEKLTRQFVSGEAFDMLGVNPAAGRLFSADEDRIPPGPPVAVLSYGYWKKRFHSDPAIVGQTLKIEGKPYEVIGITRDGFFGVEPGKFVDVWVPGTLYDSQAFTDPGWHWFRILGRLLPGTSPEQIQARLQPSFHNFQIQRVKRSPAMPWVIKKQFLQNAIRVRLAPTGVSDFRRIFSRPLWIVFGVAAGIFLIACANVASLLLARSTARSTEMAMRVSLGAARVRLVRQLLTESLMLSLLAGALGWLLARIAAPLLVSSLSNQSNPVQFALATDTRVLFFSIAASTFSAVLFGLIPAWQGSRAQPIIGLRSAGAQAGKLRLGKLFVSIQVACAFCLVMAGTAFLFSLAHLFRVNPGFDARNVAVLNFGSQSGSQNKGLKLEQMFQLQRQIGAESGIQGAALAQWPIFQSGGWSEQVIIPGKGPSEQEEIFYRVSPGYFATLRTPLLAGRDFDPRDTSEQQPGPAIVNEAFARKYFNTSNVLGQQFGYRMGKSLLREVIVGLASDAHYYDLRRSADPIVYLPAEGNNSFTLYVRFSLNLGSLVRLAEREAQMIGSGMRIREVTTLESIVGNTLTREKLLAGIGGAFAFFGLLLAAIGLFGLLTYSVGRRTREIGVRAALGAQRIEIVSLVVRDVGGLITSGLIAGLAAGLAITTAFQSLLFGIRRADPFVLGTALGLFLITGLLAASLPAYRAATMDPISALREE